MGYEGLSDIREMAYEGGDCTVKALLTHSPDNPYNLLVYLALICHRVCQITK